MKTDLKTTQNCRIPIRFIGIPKDDTPHTSLSVWALLDEGALFYACSPLLSDEIDCPN